MSWLRDLPIQRKLTFIALATCGVVLTLACLVVGGFELLEYRGVLAREMTVLADIVAANSRAALAFQDEAEASDKLVTLQAEPHVDAACLYREDGTRFAQYTRAGGLAEAPPRPAADGYRFENNSLVVYRPVELNDRRIGTIHLRANLDGVYERLRFLAGVGGLILAGAALVAVGLSARLQRTISGPILALADTARTIGERRDFSVRAVRQGSDEVGLLTDAFNEMLTGLELREAALSGVNQALRAENEERRLAEARVKTQLAHLELLNRITRAVGERQDLPSIYQVVIRSLEDDLESDLSCFAVYDQADDTLTVTGVGARGEALARQLGLLDAAAIPVGASGIKTAIRGSLVYEPDTRTAEAPFARRLAGAGLHSLVIAPLLMESNVFGTLIAARRDAGAFSSDECQFLRQLSEHVALAAHQAQLYTALQRAYDDLRQTQQAVMQHERLRALGQMASGIAHDINNAIAPVALYTELLMESEPDLSARARECLEITRRAIEDVSQTVARMKEVYRQREAQLELTRVALNQIVGQVVDLTRARWRDMPQQRGVVVRVATELAPEPVQVLGVESEIREALTNLVLNAVDAMPDGGVLTLRTRVEESALGAAGSAQVHLEVADTGVGMDDETRRRCLEPFFSTKGDRGTGLGLAMVYGTVQRHGADIEVQSAPGQGTTVRITFAAPAAGDTESEAPAPGRHVPLARLRILAIDDDPLVLRALRHVLEADGHSLTTASGGQGGIEAFREALATNHPFAVVITDLGMPHVDGRKVAAVVKTASPATPVILLTGWGQRLLADGDAPAHVDRVLSKPPKLGDLRAALAACFDPDPESRRA